MKTESESFPKIPFWVRIETGHDSRLVDVLELKAQLEAQNVPVQLSSPWHPSYSTGLEFVFELFANISFQDLIISGVLYDGFKYGLKKILNSLKTFAEKNKQEDFYPIIIIRIDDVEIVLYGYEYRSLNDQTIILEKISNHIKELYRQGINGIVRIEIPCLPCYLPEDDSLIGNIKAWRILYGTHDIAYYIPSTKQLL